MHHHDLTDQILNAYYKVRRVLPHSLEEVVYQRSLAIELRKRQLSVQREVPYQVFYEETVVGQYRADLLVSDTVLIEVKRGRRIAEDHVEQLSRYLSVSELPVGLVLNFGPRAEIRRVENWSRL